jgi:hypothetical protein
MTMGIRPDADGAAQLREARHVRIVLDQAISVGELLLWEHTEFVCFLYDNALGERAIEGFPDLKEFLRWFEGRVAGGHNVRWI